MSEPDWGIEPNADVDRWFQEHLRQIREAERAVDMTVMVS